MELDLCSECDIQKAHKLAAGFLDCKEFLGRFYSSGSSVIRGSRSRC
jgi:hypothetical protein